MDIKILCPSRGRAKNVLTTKWFPNLILVVREDEVEEYKEHNDCEVVGTPDWVDNVAKTRQWMLDEYVDEHIFMIDDDVSSVMRTYVEKGEEAKIYDTDTIYEMVRENAYVAKEIGAKMWGYQSIRNPNEYDSHKPFKHNGYMNGSHTGFLKGHGLHYITDWGEAEDCYVSLLNYYKHRFAMIDRRITFHTKDNFLADGGCNMIRTIEMMKENTLKLRRLFGEAVHIKRPTNNKKKVHQGERSISIPF